MHRQTTIEFSHNNLMINVGELLDKPCYTYIIDKIQEQLKSMTERYTRIIVIRFDLRFPDNSIGSYPSDNSCIIKFANSLSRKIKRKNITGTFMWAREKKSNDRMQHYHCYLIMDGHKVLNSFYHFKFADELWNRALNLKPEENSGLVHHCHCNATKKNFFFLDKNKPNYNYMLQEVNYWLSYLAKVNTKDNSKYRNFGCSKINW